MFFFVKGFDLIFKDVVIFSSIERRIHNPGKKAEKVMYSAVVLSLQVLSNTLYEVPPRLSVPFSHFASIYYERKCIAAIVLHHQVTLFSVALSKCTIDSRFSDILDLNDLFFPQQDN
jgi:hypothetical protein